MHIHTYIHLGLGYIQNKLAEVIKLKRQVQMTNQEKDLEKYFLIGSTKKAC